MTLSIRPLLLAGVLSLLFLSGCGPTVVYEATEETGPDGWAYADSASFSFGVPNTQQLYDLELLIRHATDFPYENFYLKIHTAFPNGKRTTERISLDLAGDYGVWHGDCSGDRCSLAVPILRNTRYQEAGTYGITLEQYSRDNPLPGIHTVGLRLLESEVP